MNASLWMNMEMESGALFLKAFCFRFQEKIKNKA